MKYSQDNGGQKSQKKHLIWTQNGQKQGEIIFFFGHGVLAKSVENGPIY